jgi:hypothetical protein
MKNASSKFMFNFNHKQSKPGLRDWMGSKVLIRHFAPQLAEVEGINTNLMLHKLNQNV